MNWMSKQVFYLMGASVALLVLLILGPALAQTSQSIEITADRFLVQDQTNEAEFSGNVVIIQTGLKVWADRVLVHYGDGGTSDIKSFEALNNVRIENSRQSATGNRAVYDPATRILRLTGNVRVINESGVVTAPELIVNLASNVSEFSTGSNGGRVTGVFTPAN